jgi:ATP-dependent Lhr-like helicase
MSREQRTLVEEELKGGVLPCVVATSSLELGIDMGRGRPRRAGGGAASVASGLQRWAAPGTRSGRSRGGVFPKYRGDLVSCAVVAERMAGGRIESMRYPRNPLDVLAQQIVAMVALEPWGLDDLAAVVRRAAPFAALPESALHSVLDMLAGRYPSEEFGSCAPGSPGTGSPTSWWAARERSGSPSPPGHDPRPRPVHGDDARRRRRCRLAGRRAGRGDGLRVAGGRRDPAGHVELAGGGHHPRPRDRHPRAGGAGAAAVLEGRVDRAAAGAGARGRGVRAGDVRAGRRRRRERAAAAGLDEWAVDNLLAYLHEQRDATRHVPSDRTILVERFRDELGDWRLVVHSPFGSQVNGPWALAIAARMRERRGVECQASAGDDGIVLRLPDAVDDAGAEVVPTAEDVLLDPAEVEQIVVAELGGSSLYASRFRECAARALLLPRRDPRRRSPAVAAAAEGLPAARRGREVRAVPGHVSRRCASACRTSTTCRGCAS